MLATIVYDSLLPNCRTLFYNQFINKRTFKTTENFTFDAMHFKNTNFF